MRVNVMNKMQLRGRLWEFTGSLQMAAGRLVGNRDLQRRGMAKKNSGRVEGLGGSALAIIKAALRRRKLKPIR
jgi:uncharacterized protein YjbJ (UPF0337 family)